MNEDSFNTVNLVNDADFEVLISKDLYWIPFNALGKSKYRNYEIEQMINLNPEEKQSKINNVYEAIQLFQLSKFKTVEDVILINYNGYLWEHHKPGYHAVLSNFGCCSSIASWLNYIIRNRYEEKGYLSFNRPDGSGHVMNYIKKDEYYHIFDLSTMTFENVEFTCKETGKKTDYIKSKYSTGICFKTKKLDYFVKYHLRLQMTKGYQFMYFLLDDYDYIPPVCVEKKDNKIIIYDSCSTTCLNSVMNIHYKIIQGPNTSPNWLLF